MTEELQYEEDGPLATVTLSRPHKLNALTFGMYEALGDRFRALRERPQIRAVILTGSGRAFCSGGDVEEIIGELLRMSSDKQREFTRRTCDVVAKMRSCPQPIVAALNGPVAGAGAALAIASDFRIATQESKIAFLFVQAGLSGADMGACFLLPRIVGLGRATELLMLGDFVPADEAQRMGLYHRIVPRETLVSEARSLADRLAKGPRVGLAETKRTLDAQMSMSFEEALAWDLKIQAACMKGADFREAYEAFREKRPRRFQP